jgi:hypothetical protein
VFINLLSPVYACNREIRELGKRARAILVFKTPDVRCQVTNDRLTVPWTTPPASPATDNLLQWWRRQHLVADTHGL